MLSKCKKIAYSLALFGVKYISDLSSLSLNRNFVVSLEYKNSNRRKVLICKFHKNCLKRSTKRQIRSANCDSQIANSNPDIHAYRIPKNWGPSLYNSLCHTDNRRYFLGLSPTWNRREVHMFYLAGKVEKFGHILAEKKVTL